MGYFHNNMGDNNEFLCNILCKKRKKNDDTASFTLKHSTDSLLLTCICTQYTHTFAFVCARGTCSPSQFVKWWPKVDVIAFTLLHGSEVI